VDTVIYSYKNINTQGKTFDDDFIKMARLSVESSSKFYKTKLYCDGGSKELFDRYNIKFDEVIVLDELNDYSGSVFCMPKIITMMHQTEPYIHLDFDVLILRKLQDKDCIGFAYPEVSISPTYNFEQIEYVYESYILPFKKYSKDKTDYKESILWNFDKIPNHGIIYVNNPNIIKSAYQQIIIDFEDVVNESKPMEGLAQYIEQFSLKRYLDENKIKYDFYEDVCNFSFEIDMNKFTIRGNSKLKTDLHFLLHHDFIHFHNYPLNRELFREIIDYFNMSIFNKKTEKINKILM